MSRKVKIILTILFAITLFAYTFWLAGYTQENKYIQDLVQDFGYIGIIFSSFVLGTIVHVSVVAYGVSTIIKYIY